jgi:hypothetical protein
LRFRFYSWPLFSSCVLGAFYLLIGSMPSATTNTCMPAVVNYYAGTPVRDLTFA